jgi:hypothetical protein
VRSPRRLTRRSPPPVGEQMARSVRELTAARFDGCAPAAAAPSPCSAPGNSADAPITGL